MVANYIKPAIGAAAYGAMARNCGILAFTPTTWAASTQKTDLDTSVSNVMTACLANSVISGLVPGAAGSIDVECIRAATAAALANVQVPPTAAATSKLLVDLAVQIAARFNAWKTNIVSVAGVSANYVLNSIGAAAYEALSINKGTSSKITAGIETDLDDQVAAIMAACHANANILALEPSTEGSQVVQELRSAVLTIFTNLGTDSASAADLTKLATTIYSTSAETFGGSNPANFCSSAAGTVSYSSLTYDRGLSSYPNPTVMIECNIAFVSACLLNGTFAAYGNSTGGSQLVRAIEAATQIAMSNIDVESIVDFSSLATPTTAMTALVAMVVALITEINTAIT